MAGKTGRIIAYALCGAMVFGQNVMGVEESSSSTTSASSSSFSFSDIIKKYTLAQRAEIATAVAKVPCSLAYRYNLGKYKNGKRSKTPVVAKTLVDALRVANGSLSLYNNWNFQDHKKSALVQRYTALWTLIDTAKLLMDILPTRVSEKIIASYDEDDDYVSANFFSWVNQKINDSEFLEALGLYFLPLLEEAATLYTAFDIGTSGKDKLIKLYVAGTKGALRSLNELLDTNNPKLRTCYFMLFLAHLASIGFDIYTSPFEEQMKLEKEKLAAEKLEQEKLEQEKLEQEKLAAEKLEQEKLAAEKLEQEKLEQEKLAAEKLEQEKLEQEKLAAEKLAAEKLEQEKLEQEKLEQEKLAAEKLAAEKLAAEKLEQEKLAAEKLEQEKLAAEKLAAEKLEQEKLAAEKLEQEKLAAEKLEQEKLEQEKLAAEKLAAEKLEQEKLAAEKLEQEKLAAEKLEQEKLAAEKLAAEKLEQEKLAAEKLEQEKLAAEKLEKEKLAEEVESSSGESDEKNGRRSRRFKNKPRVNYNENRPYKKKK